MNLEFDSERKYLVSSLKRTGYIKSNAVEQAFLKIPREDFVPNSMKSLAYMDKPLEIGEGQTISAPHMVAIMCEALDIQKGQTILEIGAGSGYHAAIVSKIVGTTGHIYSVERIQSLVKYAEENLKTVGITNVTVIGGDGSEGLEEYAPYDRIYVTCAAPIVPQPLLDQLKNPGKLLIPVGNMYCELRRIDKEGSEITERNFGGCVFVPLIGKYGH